jgi:hypothetical protein
MQIAGQLSPIQLDAHPGQGQQGLGLGGECQALPILQHVERLDTDAVATDQGRAATVPQGKVEHAIEAKNEIVAEGTAYAMEQHLTVGARS